MSNDIKRLRATRLPGRSGAGTVPVQDTAVVPGIDGSELDREPHHAGKDDREEAGQDEKPRDTVTLSDEARSLQSDPPEGGELGDAAESYRRLAHLRPELTEEPEFQDLLDRVLGKEPASD